MAEEGPENESQEPSYDSDGEPIKKQDKKKIEPLPPVDHNTFVYAPFTRCFYKQCEEVASMSTEEVSDYLSEIEVATEGNTLFLSQIYPTRIL
jgi:hypothetical protein